MLLLFRNIIKLPVSLIHKVIVKIITTHRTSIYLMITKYIDRWLFNFAIIRYNSQVVPKLLKTFLGKARSQT